MSRLGTVGVASVVALTAACTPPHPPPPATGAATVAQVVDGDTLVLHLDSGTERVRLLGIDTPETSHPTRPVECFAAEASARLTELVPPGTPVRVERDTEPRDHYGRLLLYLYRAADDLFVNLDLVASGHAVALHVEPNGAHRSAIAAAESQARAGGLGLWGTCGGPGVAVDPLAPAEGATTP